MILSDRDIVAALDAGRIKIDPAPDLATQLGSVSIDFRLGRTFMVFEHSRHSYIDPRQPHSIGEAMRTIEVDDEEPFIMQPGDFALASTIESLELPDDLLGRLEGRSSIARLGITVHSTAAVFEPGWTGTATMELSNLGRMAVALYPG
ncbi:MAG TPA: dCTP deaminase, partial [Thermomicrobiales bacterium]|nr:dCTP deaminase [Thermomicrobiales bacterium]